MMSFFMEDPFNISTDFVFYNITKYYTPLFSIALLPSYPLMEESNILNTIYVQQGMQGMFFRSYKQIYYSSHVNALFKSVQVL